ncbi:hypothetical protein FB451DRAFT_1451536 [Mycena latifolia]|nr:hypothetical protein FB451DRAFT_1451536 [Mycena latifolia]
MDEPGVFEDHYSDPESSEPDSDESDFDPAVDIPMSDTENAPGEAFDPETADAGTVVDPPPMTPLVFNLGRYGLRIKSHHSSCTRRSLKSERLPGILRRWHKPPRPAKSKKHRPKGATAVMERFALECSQGILERELELLAHLFDSPAGEDITEEQLTGLSFPATVKEAKKIAPNLFAALFRLARTEGQQERNPANKNGLAGKLDRIFVIAIFSYTRTHHRGRLQKLFAIYFKFRGLSAKGFDTLHAIGLTMSNKWTGNAVDRISAESMKEMRRLMDLFPWLMSYDNALVAFRVFAQRVDRKTLNGNGTAGTVYIKRSAKPLPKEINRMLQEFRKEGMKNPLTGVDIFKISLLADTRRVPHIKFLILHYLFESPEFDFANYDGKDHPLLQKPPAIQQLPVGKDHVVLQYLLGMLDIPETSYEDNARIILEWLKQLHYHLPDAQKKLGLEQLMAWVGDQLTIDRLRNLYRFRAEDDNSFERLDWLHLGTAKGRGLSAAFDVLNRKGLQTSHTQGAFFHDLNEVLHFIAEAQIREVWLQVGKATDLAELRQKTPEDLYKLAEQIVADHASSGAIVRMKLKPRSDELKLQSIMFLRDVLPYILPRSAVKHGDVGIMEDMIPLMLFRFIGGKNSHYAGEMLELLQGLNREWPPELCEFIPRDGGFMPVDEAQEMNIKDIKVTYRSEGPNIDWDYLKKLHPAIHVIRAVNSHMEYEFKTRVRGRKR